MTVQPDSSAASSVSDGAIRWKASLWGLLAICVAGPAICTLVGFGGRWWWALELASHFRMQYFTLLALGSLAFFLGRRRKLAACSLLLAIVNLAFIAPLYCGASSPRAGAPTFRAMFLNLNTSNDQYGKVLDFIRLTGPDFIVLAEASDRWMKELDDGLGGYPSSRVKSQEDNFGIAILSDLPILDGGIISIGQAGVPSVMVRLHTGHQPFTVIGTHPPPPTSRLWAWHRDKQLQELAEVVLQQQGPLIVMSDLNATSWSPCFADLLAETGLKDSRQGFGLQPTWPCSMPLLRIPIDHCFVSSEIVVHGRWVGPDVGSDHYPIVVEFSLPAP